MSRFGRRKAKMIGICLLAMLSSPFIASITIREFHIFQLQQIRLIYLINKKVRLLYQNSSK